MPDLDSDNRGQTKQVGAVIGKWVAIGGGILVIVLAILAGVKFYANRNPAAAAPVAASGSSVVRTDPLVHVVRVTPMKTALPEAKVASVPPGEKVLLEFTLGTRFRYRVKPTYGLYKIYHDGVLYNENGTVVQNTTGGPNAEDVNQYPEYSEVLIENQGSQELKIEYLAGPIPVASN